MGNSQSGASPVDHSYQLDSVAQSFSQLQLEDEQLYFTSPTSQTTTRYDTRRWSKPPGPEDLRRSPGKSPHGSSTELVVETDGPRVPLSQLSAATLPGGQLNIQAAIVIIQELTKTASPDQLAVLHKAVTSLTSNGTESSVSSALTEHNKTLKDTKMIRRRTLLTPGVATRGLPPNPATATTSPSSTTETLLPPWRPEMFGQSPLSRLAGWQSSNDGKPGLARSATPDFNGSYLGAHELGSLRVMNSTPVPSISEKRPQTTDSNRSTKHEEYYTASEGSGRDSPDKFDQPLQDDQHNTAQSPSKVLRLPMLQLEDVDHDLSFASSTGSTALETRDTDVDEETTEIRDRATLTVGGSPERPLSALMMYSLEASSNPFLAQPAEDQEDESGLDPEPRPSLKEAVSKAGLQDPGYSSDGETSLDPCTAAPHFPPPSRDPPQIPPPFSHSRHSILSASSSVYSSTSRNQKDDKVQSSRVRPTYDSGYGSQNSLNMPKDDSAGVASAQEYPCTDAREPKLPQLEMPSTSTMFNSHDHASASRSAPCESSSLPQTAPTTPLKLTSSLQSNLTEASPQHEKAQRRLRKRRPKSETWNSAPLVVQTYVGDRSDFIGLPRVPSVLTARYKDRMSKNPDMEHLERTFKSTSHADSRESLVSHEVNPISIRFPEPPRPDPSQPLESGQKLRKSSGEQASTSRRFFRSKSRKSKERKTSAGEYDTNDDTTIGIADFGDASASLGSSPYDFARSAGEHTPNLNLNLNKKLPDPKTMRHPHQMSSEMPRKKIGMDDRAASAFALERSRDRLENSRLAETSNQNQTRRPSQYPLQGIRERPHSFHSMQGMREPLAASPLMRESNTRPARDIFDSSKEIPGKAEWPPANTWLEDVAPRQPQLANGEAEQTPQERLKNDEGHDEITDRWERSARAWRLRRKSIGENLRQHPRESQFADEHASKRGHIRNDDGDSRYLRSPDPVQNRGPSPTPSVRELAAAYERSVGTSNSPDRLAVASPSRRAPSPPKIARASSPTRSLSDPELYPHLPLAVEGRQSPEQKMRFHAGLQRSYDINRAIGEGLILSDIPMFLRSSS